MSTKLLASLLLCVCLMFQPGCGLIGNYYPIHSVEEPVSLIPTSRANNNPSASVTFEFQHGGKTSTSVTTQYQPYVLEIMERSRLFSAVSSQKKSSQASMRIVVNHFNSAGSVVAAFIYGLTLGLTGFSVTDSYAIDARYQSAQHGTLTKQYSASIISTRGLLVSGVGGVTPQENIDDAFKEILSRALRAWLADLQHEGKI